MKGEVAVIGSGLAAIAACNALIERGIKPIVLDVGKELPPQKNKTVNLISKKKVHEWSISDRIFLNKNPTVHGKQHPKKLSFGSDYFYGQAGEADISCHKDEVDCPPFSFAKGGFSVGWGGSVLFPDQADLIDWPIEASKLAPYFRDVMQELPYSATQDGLALNFPLMRNSSNPIRATTGNRMLLAALDSSDLLVRDEVVFGQSRLLLQASDCQYCGACLSGCVYDAIYKSNHTLDALVRKNLIDYRPGILVDKLDDMPHGVIVHFKDDNGDNGKLFFDRIFLAAGAVNSPSIVMKSKFLYGHTAIIKTTCSFIAPLFSFKTLPLDWPRNNTMPGIFFEYKAKELSNHWIHTQISTPNELVLNKLGIQFSGVSPLQKIKRKLAEHLVIAHGNLHSNHANHYKLTLNKNSNTDVIFTSLREPPEDARKSVKTALKRLAKLTPSFGCYVLKPFALDTVQSHGFHLGGGLPMKKNPILEMDTDLLGRPFGWKNIHVVDSSVFPSIPSTTVGVLAMANARRIVLESIENQDATN